MLKFRLAVSSVVSLLAVTGSALAQAPAAAEPATPPPVAPAAPAAPAAADTTAAPAPTPASAEASATATAEAPPATAGAAEAPAAAPAPEEEKASIPGWFRIDSDLNGLQLWVGATHDLGGLAIASDMYVGMGSGGFNFGEFDIGPAFTFADGALLVTPMIGAAFGWSEKRTVSLVPQLYLVGGAGPLYFESWWQMFLNKPFTDGSVNFLYSRDFVTYALSDDFAIGPEVDPTFGMGDGQDTVTSLPVGGVVKLNYGKDNTFFGFLGYETNEDARTAAGGSGDRGLAGRLTFVKNW